MTFKLCAPAVSATVCVASCLPLSRSRTVRARLKGKHEATQTVALTAGAQSLKVIRIKLCAPAVSATVCTAQRQARSNANCRAHRRSAEFDSDDFLHARERG